MPHFLNLSLSSLKTMLERGETTSVQLVEQALEGFDQLNPLINAVVTTHPELSIRYAEKADTLRAKGEIVGPLHGIPMTIKDSLDTFDMNTTWGTVTQRASRSPSANVASSSISAILQWWVRVRAIHQV